MHDWAGDRGQVAAKQMYRIADKANTRCEVLLCILIRPGNLPETARVIHHLYYRVRRNVGKNAAKRTAAVRELVPA